MEKRRVKFTNLELKIAQENIERMKAALPEGNDEKQKRIRESMVASLDIGIEAIEIIMAMAEGRIIKSEVTPITQRFMIMPESEDK